MTEAHRLLPAALWRRLAAIAYDLLLVLALWMVVTAVVIAARRGAAVDPGSAWYQILLLAVWWLYFAWSWTHGGQTIGMRAWRLTLTSGSDSGAVSWREAGIRFLGAGLSLLPAGLGFLWSLADRDGLAWHDRLSHTALGYGPRSSEP